MSGELITYNHVTNFEKSYTYCSPPSKSKDELHKLKSPDPEKFWGSRDYGHCFRGWIFGQACLLMSVVSLGIFYAWVNQGRPEVRGLNIIIVQLVIIVIFSISFMPSQKTDTSYLSKVTVVVFSGIGLIAATMGIFQIEVC